MEEKEETPTAEGRPASEVLGAPKPDLRAAGGHAGRGTAPHPAWHAGGGGAPLPALPVLGRNPALEPAGPTRGHGPSFRLPRRQRSSQFRRRDSELLLPAVGEGPEGDCLEQTLRCGSRLLRSRSLGIARVVRNAAWAGWRKGAQCARPLERLSTHGGVRGLGAHGAGAVHQGVESSRARVRAAFTAGAQCTLGRASVRT